MCSSDLRVRYGLQSRMDYLDLPEQLLRKASSDLREFGVMRALVMRYGKSWQHFSESLKRLGYQVVYTDKGVQPMTLTLELVRLAEEVDGIVLVTASRRIGPVVENLLYSGISLKIASFSSIIEVGGVEREAPGYMAMDDSWLWSGEQREHSLQ